MAGDLREAVAQAIMDEIIRQDGEFHDDKGFMLESTAAHYVYLDTLLIAKVALSASARGEEWRPPGGWKSAHKVPYPGPCLGWSQYTGQEVVKGPGRWAVMTHWQPLPPPPSAITPTDTEESAK